MDERRGTSALPWLGFVGAALVVVLLSGGLKSFLGVLPSLALQNWLIVLFRINAGQLGTASLRVLNPIDFAALVLVGITFLGLWPILARGRRIWVSIAVALPFIGVPLLAVTHLAGRSAVMGAGLVVSFLMLRTPGFKPVGYLGIVANALLLTADFNTTGSPVSIVAAAVGVGYLLLLVWFAWVALLMWWRAQGGRRRGGTPNKRIEQAA